MKWTPSARMPGRESICDSTCSGPPGNCRHDTGQRQRLPHYVALRADAAVALISAPSAATVQNRPVCST